MFVHGVPDGRTRFVDNMIHATARLLHVKLQFDEQAAAVVGTDFARRRLY